MAATITRDALARLEGALLKAGHIDRLRLEGLRPDQVQATRSNDFNTRRYSDSGLRKVEASST